MVLAGAFYGGLMPKVSVCIPSYNLAYCIGRTIESVLAQTFTDFELLIEDDGSTDNSVAVIQAYADTRITLVSKLTNEGQNETTNNLCKRAAGEYIACLPADDTWAADKLEKQVAYLDANPACGMVFSHPEFIDDSDATIAPAEGSPEERVQGIGNMERQFWQKRFMVGNCLFIATSLHRRALHEEIGYFDESLHLLADLDFYIRAVKSHDLHVIQEPLARVRMRADRSNLSHPSAAAQERHVDELALVRAKNRPGGAIKEKKFFIATPFYELKGHSPYIKSLVDSLCGLAKYGKETGIEFEFHTVDGDSYVWRARNSIADRFLKSDCSHLIFIDSDESWEPEGLYRLMKADAPIVGAAYPVKNNWAHFGVVIHTEGENHVAKTTPAGLIYADKVPTGFMKISREVFAKIRAMEPDNWYWEPDEYGTMSKRHNYFGHVMEAHIMYGEDISFCRRWQRTGGELFVEPRVTISHYGTKGWTGNYDTFLRSQKGGDLDPERHAA